jgi:hypothetical protein
MLIGLFFVLHRPRAKHTFFEHRILQHRIGQHLLELIVLLTLTQPLRPRSLPVEYFLTSVAARLPETPCSTGNGHSGPTPQGGIIRRCCVRLEALAGQYGSFFRLNIYDWFYGGSL